MMDMAYRCPNPGMGRMRAKRSGRRKLMTRPVVFTGVKDIWWALAKQLLVVFPGRMVGDIVIE